MTTTTQEVNFRVPVCPQGHDKRVVGVYRYRCKECIKLKDREKHRKTYQPVPRSRWEKYTPVDWEAVLGEEPERWVTKLCVGCQRPKQMPEGADKCGYCLFATSTRR